MVQTIKNASALLLLLFGVSCLDAQNSYLFNKTFKPDTMNTLSPAILRINDGYLLAHTFNSLEDREGFGVRKLDEYGNTLWFNNLHISEEQHLMIGGGILIPGHIPTTYILAGSMYYEDSSDKDIVLIQFLEDGTHVWTNFIEQPDSIEGVYHISPTSDGGYIMCGIKRSFTVNNRFYVLKVDAFGNKEWDRVYYPDSHGSAFNIIERAQDFVVSGGIYFEGNSYDAVVLSIDKENGEQNWMHQYGNDNNDTSCMMKVLSNEEIVILYSSQDAMGNQLPQIKKLSTNGANVIWENDFNIPVIGGQETPILNTSDEGSVGMFAVVNNYGNYYTSIWRFTATGDTLWTRTIPDLDPYDNWYLKDIAATPDGGYILSGFNYSQQSSWVVKTDSLGYTCSYLGCEEEIIISSVDNTEYVETLETTSIRIAPNPAREYTTIHNPSPQAGHWLLYNALGQLVAQQPLAPNSQQQLLISHLPTGIYVWQFGQQSGRLVVR